MNWARAKNIGVKFSYNWLLPTLLIGAGAYWEIRGCYNNTFIRGSSAHKIQPPPPGKTYHGSWNNDCVSPPQIICHEWEIGGEKVDIAFRFINFKEFQTTYPFPKEEAKYMWKRGGTIFLALQPWKGKGTPELLGRIGIGDFNDELEAFAKGAAKYNGPAFLAFAPGMNDGPEPWAKKPGAYYVKAYRQAHEIISKYAPNLTWVWSVNVGENIAAYWPGGDYVDWIAVNFFHHSGESVETLLKRVEATLQKLRKYNKPIMIGRFGSSGRAAEKVKFFDQVFRRMKGWGIKAFIHFNFAEARNGSFINFMLNSDEVRLSYMKGLNQLNLEGNIVTGKGELKTKIEDTPPDNCALIREKFWDMSERRQIEELESFIKNREDFIKKNKDPHENNNFRLQLAQAYRQLSRLAPFRKDRSESIRRAFYHLKTALKSPDNSIIYHPSIPYVREYFEILLELADLYLEKGKNREALAWLNRIDLDLSNPEILWAHNISPDSVPGYRNRNKLIRAQYLERRKKFHRAKTLYAEVARWASQEQGKSWITHLWKGEKRSELRFVAVKAKLGVIRIALRPGTWQRVYYTLREFIKTTLRLKTASNRNPWQAPRMPHRRLEYIFEKINEIFKWEGIGIEKGGYINLAFEAFIYAMEACMFSSESLAEAKSIFESFLPWARINSLPDLKKAMGIEEDLTDPEIDVWNVILRGLTQARIADESLQDRLSALREFSE